MIQRPTARRDFARNSLLGNSARTGILLFAAAASLFVGAARPSQGAEIEDIEFPKTVVAGDTEVPLFGLGLLRYRVLFRGYVGGLYMPAGAKKDEVFQDVPKALELYYFWDIPGSFFGEAADDLLAKNLPPERLASLRARLDRLNAMYKDVDVGDRYRLTYVPGEGTTVRLNGESLGTIPGADFARDYFSIWLGKNPLSVPFRDQIMNGL